MLVEPIDCYILDEADDLRYYQLQSLKGWSENTLAEEIGSDWVWCDSWSERYIRFYIDRIPRVMGFIYMRNPYLFDGEDVGLGFYNAETNIATYYQIPGFDTTSKVAELTPQKLTNLQYHRQHMVYREISLTRGYSNPRLEKRIPNIIYSSEPLPKRLTAKTRKDVTKKMLGDVILQMIMGYQGCEEAAYDITRWYIRHHSTFFSRFLLDKTLEDDWNKLQETLYDRIIDEIEDCDFWPWYLEEAESIELLFRDL